MKDQIAKILDTFAELSPVDQVAVFTEVKQQLLNMRACRAEEHTAIGEKAHSEAKSIYAGSDTIANGISGSVMPTKSSY